jgi:hypothetical protein
MSDDIRKMGAYLPISKEVAYGTYALPTPFHLYGETPAERAEREARLAEFRVLKAAAQPRLHASLAALASIADEPDRAILDLHALSEQYGICQGCDFGGAEAEEPDWPCRTVRLIAERHGIDLEGFYLYDKEWKPDA